MSSAVAGGRWDRGGFRSRDRGDDDDGRGGQSWGGGGNWGGGWNGGNSNGGNSGGGWNGGSSWGGSASQGGGGSSSSATGGNSSSSQGTSSNLASPSGQSQDQSSRGDRRDSDESGQKGSGRGSAAAADAPDEGPPRTVMELFKRVFNAPPAPPAPPPPVNRPAPGAHPAPRNAEPHKWEAVVHRGALGEKGRDKHNDKGKAVPRAPSVVKAAAAPVNSVAAKPRLRLPGGLGPVVVPQLSDIKPNVLLGVGLGKPELARLRDLGFKERGSSDVGIGRVTELAVPEGYDALGARDLASRELPGQAFTYSVRYRVEPESERGKPPGAKDEPFNHDRALHPCEGDRCYGPQLLSWRSGLSSCAKGVKVGVVDTAVDLGHPALGGMRAKFGSFGNGSVASERIWHGTGVASLLAGDAGSPTPGLIPQSEFLIADIFSDGEEGIPESDTVGLLKALNWMDRLGANVVNLSISGVRDEAVEPVVADMAKRGVIFVAAAGNDGPSGKPSYPAAYREVIAVTAVNKNLLSYSNATHGDYVDVSAPGVHIWTALPNERMGYRTGTSFATPFVTSIMAALYSSTPVKTKAALLHRLRPEMQDLGPTGRDPIYGWGLLRAPKDCAPPVALTTSAIKTKSGEISSAAAR